LLVHPSFISLRTKNNLQSFFFSFSFRGSAGEWERIEREVWFRVVDVVMLSLSLSLFSRFYALSRQNPALLFRPLFFLSTLPAALPSPSKERKNMKPACLTPIHLAHLLALVLNFSLNQISTCSASKAFALHCFFCNLAKEQKKAIWNWKRKKKEITKKEGGKRTNESKLMFFVFFAGSGRDIKKERKASKRFFFYPPPRSFLSSASIVAISSFSL